MLAAKPEPRPGPFTWDEYMAWEAEQAEKWELVDGYAVPRDERWAFDPAVGMAGARRFHNLAVANLVRHLGNRLAGGPCAALPSDMLARVSPSTSRYPDVTVECGQTDMDGLISEPVVLFEALSKSNTLRQQLRLLDDYQAIPTVQQIVFVERERPAALSWTRTDESWRREEYDGLDAVIRLPALQIELPLAEVYERFPFAAVAQAG